MVSSFKYTRDLLAGEISTFQQMCLYTVNDANIDKYMVTTWGIHFELLTTKFWNPQENPKQVIATLRTPLSAADPPPAHNILKKKKTPKMNNSADLIAKQRRKAYC